jgi:hypothetical protein
MPRIIKSAKGTFTAATITVDGQGRVVAASSGSAGGKGFVFAVGASNNETVTYTASPLATGDIYGALIGGGGGGGTGGSGGGNGEKEGLVFSLVLVLLVLIITQTRSLELQELHQLLTVKVILDQRQVLVI